MKADSLPSGAWESLFPRALALIDETNKDGGIAELRPLRGHGWRILGQPVAVQAAQPNQADLAVTVDGDAGLLERFARQIYVMINDLIKTWNLVKFKIK